jgi:hypothetical protein
MSQRELYGIGLQEVEFWRKNGEEFPRLPVLKVLHGPFMFQGRSTGAECSQVPSFSCLVFFTGIQPVPTASKLAYHDRSFKKNLPYSAGGCGLFIFLTTALPVSSFEGLLSDFSLSRP